MHVLYVAYHFPPIGGPGAHRSLNVTRQLVENGVDVTVVTGPGPSDEFWTPQDEMTERAVPGRVRVIRITEPEPTVSGARRRIERWLPGHTKFGAWFERGALGSIRKLEERPDVVFGLIVPYECGVAVRDLADRVGSPWVADLLDPWALDEMWLYPTVAQRLLDRLAMRRSLESAAAVIMNTREAAERVRSAFPRLANRVTTIPSGYDGRDYEATEPSREWDGDFRIVHTGSMHTELGLRHRRTRKIRRILGGLPFADVDYLTRSHVYLLRAIDELLEREPWLRDRIRVEFAGALTDADRHFMKGRPYVHVHGYLSHPEMVALIRSADLLFLPMHNLGGRAGLVPSKTYEYLASGRPILAAVPKGDARDLLESAGTAVVVEPDDSAAMARAISDSIVLRTPHHVDLDLVGRFEYRRLGRSIVALLESVRAGRPLPPSDFDERSAG